MQSFRNVKKRFFPPGYEIVQHEHDQLAPFKLSAIVQFAIDSLLPSEVKQGEELRDLKGGEWQERELTAALPLLSDELLCVEGRFHTGASAKERAPFSLRISTPFLRFEGNHHIVFKNEVHAHGELFSYITPLSALSTLGRLIPVEILQFRLALNLMRSRRWGVLGFAPVVGEGLYLEATARELSLTLWGEGLQTEKFELLETRGFCLKVEELLRVLQRITEIA